MLVSELFDVKRDFTAFGGLSSAAGPRFQMDIRCALSARMVEKEEGLVEFASGFGGISRTRELDFDRSLSRSNARTLLNPVVAIEVQAWFERTRLQNIRFRLGRVRRTETPSDALRFPECFGIAADYIC